MSIHSDLRTKDERGASAIEYGLLVAAIAAVIVAVVFALGTVTKGAYTNTCHNLNAHISGTC